MPTQAVRERLLNLKLRPPSLLKVDGYAINWLLILIHGPAGSGKSTLAHAWLHQAERSEITIKVDGKDMTVRFVPIGLLLESLTRMHSYNECVEQGVCPLVSAIDTSRGGNVQETALGVVRKKVESAKAGAREIVIPFVVVDSAAYLVQGTEKLADRWRGVSGFLDGLGALSPYGVVVMIDQERAAIQSAGPFPQQRPSIAASLQHRFHLKVRMVRTGAEATTFRLTPQIISMAEPRVPASPIEIPRDSLQVLIPQPGEGRGGAARQKEAKGAKGVGGAKGTEPIVRVEFDGWVEIYVPR